MPPNMMNAAAPEGTPPRRITDRIILKKNFFAHRASKEALMWGSIKKYFLVAYMTHMKQRRTVKKSTSPHDNRKNAARGLRSPDLQISQSLNPDLYRS